MALYSCVVGGQGNGENPYLTIDGYNMNEYPIRNLVAFFKNNNTFNSKVTIGSQVRSCAEMFNNASNFNQPVEIPENVIYCTSMFEKAYNFNSPVTILQNNYISSTDMFLSCYNFNSIIYYTNYYSSPVSMFAGTNFNMPFMFTSPRGLGAVDDFQSVFSSSNYNSPVVFRPRRNNVIFNYTFANSITVADIIIDSSLCNLNNYNYSSFYCYKMLNNRRSDSRINIYCEKPDLFAYSNAGYSITGSSMIWNSTTNGYYSSSYNIYILNNVGNALDKFNTSYKNIYGVDPIYLP